MNKELICFVDPYAIDWKVASADEEWSTSIRMENFEYILDICEMKDARNLKLVGPNTFALGLAERLNSIQTTQYNQFKVNVEVI